MSALSLELFPTKTHAVRECEWFRISKTDGVLVIRLRRRPNGKEESDCYGVEEIETGNPDVRAFLVENPDDSPDTYETVIGPGWQFCTCTAGLVTKYTQKHSCKHRDALMCLVATGEM